MLIKIVTNDTKPKYQYLGIKNSGSDYVKRFLTSTHLIFSVWQLSVICVMINWYGKLQSSRNHSYVCATILSRPVSLSWLIRLMTYKKQYLKGMCPCYFNFRDAGVHLYKSFLSARGYPSNSHYVYSSTLVLCTLIL